MRMRRAKSLEKLKVCQPLIPDKVLIDVILIARFLSVLASVQSKLAHLESENAISRRRVRELERELDACKVEVARERTRVMERESVIVQQREDVQRQTQRTETQGKGKGKAKTTRFEDDGELEERYREVVEEKKGTNFSFVLCARD
jgi:chromosome segregation ATPase